MKPTFTAITFLNDRYYRQDGHSSQRAAKNALIADLPPVQNKETRIIPIQIWESIDGEAPLLVADLELNRRDGTTKPRNKP